MFDLITGRTEHIPSTPALPLFISVTVQAAVVGGLLAVSMLWVTGTLPEIPTMMAFVAEPPAAPLPPPPPAPAVKKTPPTVKRDVPATSIAAPVEVPTSIEPEPADEEGFEEGVPGGVEGGVPGGVPGGVLGGLPQEPPPPPPARPSGPVRVGGKITTPALVHRIEPNYPEFAARAGMEGVSILEAIVDERGRVAEVRVLRTAGPLLDREAIAAVRQWRYTPLVLNETPVRFILTVTLSFRLDNAGE
jgi:protein TonB